MKTEIIAEVAQGYEGKPWLADLLVKGAIATGADSVKLQLIYAEELCIRSYPYYDFFESLEMPMDVWRDLVKQVHDANMKIYFDVYGLKSLRIAQELGCDGIKISTTDFYNTVLIEKSFSSVSKIFLSTGGVPIGDLDAVVNACPTNIDLTLMHGFQAEPTATADNNLSRISVLKERYKNAKVGFMDHTLGSDEEAFYLPMIALGQGVSCIEKHISLDHSLEIEDYISALSIDRFKQFTSLIRRYEISLGSSSFEMSEKELEYKRKAGKVIVAGQNLEKGKILLLSDLAMKRVSTDPSPDYFREMSQVVGEIINANISKDEPLNNTLIS
jgi:N,N'-diacetyllegionaminate synthase